MSRKLANGIACFGPSFFVTVAFILSQSAQRKCNYVSIDGGGSNILDGVPRALDKAGVYCWQGVGGGNYLYGQSALDQFEGTDATRDLSLATTVMGATAWTVFFLAGCVRFPPAVWMLMSAVLVATTVTEGLVYQRMLHNLYCDGGGVCSRGPGAKCAIAAMAFWSLSSIMCCGVFREARDRKEAEDEGVDVSDVV
mmetsp:Transcript_34892/g.83421  ORF Transcript_34892/g.83421 Transcript_34892/m.83421 type:complete len:196 (+) Transcript_34892:73-660(+)